jgi:hypothetical protein
VGRTDDGLFLVLLLLLLVVVVVVVGCCCCCWLLEIESTGGAKAAKAAGCRPLEGESSSRSLYLLQS